MTAAEYDFNVAIVVPGMPSPKVDANARHSNPIYKTNYVKAEKKRGTEAVICALDAESREWVAERMRSMDRVPYRVTIGLAKGAKQRESDNVAIWPKALRDGIAAALAGERGDDLDRNWELIETRQVRDPEKTGYTAFEFAITEDADVH